MSAKCDYTDKQGNGKEMEFISVSKPDQTRKRATENPGNSEDTKKPKPAEANVSKYLEFQRKYIQGLSRRDLEKLTIRLLSEHFGQHAKMDEEVVLMKIKNKNQESQISQLSSTITTTRQKCHEIEVEYNKLVASQNGVLEIIQRMPIQFGCDGNVNSTLPNEPARSGEEKPVVQETAEIAEQPSSSQKAMQHPAPLPVLPLVYVVNTSCKAMAPAPELRRHLVQDRIALTWFLRRRQQEDMCAYEPTLFYQVYCYKVTSAPPSTEHWHKLVELTALPLPMTCFVAKRTVGKYYFAVRAIDVEFRVGPFSSPVSITFKDGPADLCLSAPNLSNTNRK